MRVTRQPHALNFGGLRAARCIAYPPYDCLYFSLIPAAFTTPPHRWISPLT